MGADGRIYGRDGARRDWRSRADGDARGAAPQSQAAGRLHAFRCARATGLSRSPRPHPARSAISSSAMCPIGRSMPAMARKRCNNRLAPGDGDVPLAAICSPLCRATCSIGLEVPMLAKARGRAWPARLPRRCCRRKARSAARRSRRRHDTSIRCSISPEKSRWSPAARAGWATRWSRPLPRAGPT